MLSPPARGHSTRPGVRHCRQARSTAMTGSSPGRPAPCQLQISAFRGQPPAIFTVLVAVPHDLVDFGTTPRLQVLPHRRAAGCQPGAYTTSNAGAVTCAARLAPPCPPAPSLSRIHARHAIPPSSAAPGNGRNRVPTIAFQRQAGCLEGWQPAQRHAAVWSAFSPTRFPRHGKAGGLFLALCVCALLERYGNPCFPIFDDLTCRRNRGFPMPAQTAKGVCHG